MWGKEMLRGVIEAVKGGKKIYCGSREVHDEMGDGIGNGKGFRGRRWLF